MRHFYSSWLERALRAALPDLHRVEDRDARAAAIQCEVLELGLRYNVNLAVGQKGGLFLDQRENRLRVREMARGRNVLNLFCYTGGFSLNAALGGAASVTSVDMSPAVIEAARENFRLNGLTGGEWRFVAADAYSFLEQAFQEKLRWDLVITDPPAFASSSTHVDNAIAAYTSLHRLALRITMPDSIVCFSSCSSRINSEIFLSTIHDAAAAVRRRIFIEGTHRAAFDHPPHPYLPTTDYLKFVVARVKPQPRLPHEAFLKK
jgi:23S rRNA (cytosine1962-C5)-methyltransferase